MMMLGKKPGPPVPPRPSAVAVALARSNRCGSPNGGRTIIYKSPSIEAKPAKNPLNHVKCDSKVNAVTCDKSNDDAQTERNIQIVGHDVVKAEIYIDRENAENCSPVPKPRTNHQKSKAKVVGNESPPSLPTNLPPPLIKPYISTSSVIISTPVVETTNTTTAVVAENNTQSALDVNMESKNNKKNQNYTNMNNNTLPKFGLTDEKADHENRRGANNKLMTEILIEKSNKNFRMPLIETKNLTAFKKFASENNLHSPDAMRKVLPNRPEPEGGERDQLFQHDLDAAEPTNGGKRVAFHEMLISELTEMRNKEPIGVTKLPRHESERNLCEISPNGTTRARIRTSDWIEVSDNGQPEVFSSCQISLEDSGMEDEEKLDDASSGVGDSWDSAKDAEERFSMSLPGLPPLPKSLSGLEMKRNENENHHTTTSIASLDTPPRGLSTSVNMTGNMTTTPPSTNRKTSTLDTQLAVLRREMYGLRQLDLSLLSQLWALNESIQDFRSMLQEQDTLSPPSPSPSNSELNSITSEDENDDDDELNHHTQQQQQQQQHLPIEQQIATQRMRARPPPPPKTRPV